MAPAETIFAGSPGGGIHPRLETDGDMDSCRLGGTSEFLGFGEVAA